MAAYGREGKARLRELIARVALAHLGRVQLGRPKQLSR